MQYKKVKLLISAFAVIAALGVLAAPAFAQGVAFQASSLPQQARVEGLTETMGAVVIQATGNGTITGGSSITVVYSGTVTNTASINNLSGAFGGAACAGAGCTGGAGSTATFGVVGSGNQLTVQIVGAPTTYVKFATGDYIVISQVRVNVNALGSGASTVTATMSGTSSLPASNPITFTQATVVVASIVSPSISASSSAASPALQTCNILASALSVTVTERYPAALTTLAQEQSFTPTVLPAPVNGTSVSITFTGIPAGLAIAYASQAPVGTSTLVATAPTFVAPVGGSATYSFPITTSNTSAAEGIKFNFTVGRVNSGGTALTTDGAVAALGTTSAITASVGLSPVQSSSTIIAFAANSTSAGTVATIGDCVTNLLFPFITNQVGFDSSIQIANTTSDDLAFGTGLGAASQSGTCTLSFYPTDLTTQTPTASGTAGTPSQITTASIPAGGVYSTLQSATSFKNQSGYMFAVCRFLDAHGFSFVTNGPSSTATISQGLLALIVTNTGNPRSTGTTFESLLH